MTGRAQSRVFRKLKVSPQEATAALRAFSQNARSFCLTKEQAVEKYNDKWVAIHSGNVAAVADTLEQLVLLVAAKNIPSSEALFRHISPKEKVFIL